MRKAPQAFALTRPFWRIRVDETDGNHGPTCRLIEWFRPLSPCPPQAGCWYSRLERRPYVRLIVLGNGPRHAIGLGPRIPKQPLGV